VNVLVISAHPDDETLGCGGTLLRHVAEGDQIHWLIATEGHSPRWSKDVIAKKAKEVKSVAAAYSAKSVTKLGFPSARMESLPLEDVIDGIRSAVEKTRPKIVYLPHFGDVHTDHAVVSTATMAILKSFYMKKCGVESVLAFETLSSTEAAPPYPYRAFVPNVFRDVTPYFERKLKIMKMFNTEAQSELAPRAASAIRALARFRGASVNVEYAEAFMLVRELR